MKTNVIQSMLALNAGRIHFLHCTIEDHLFQASYDKLNGNASFAADEYSLADRERSKLRKAVELQRQMKAELAGIHREARIATKLQEVKSIGVKIDKKAFDAMTSYAQEADLDELLALFVQPKPDSRKAA